MFRPIIEIAVLPMFYTGQAVAHGRPIAFQSIRDDDPRHIGQPLRQPAEESPRLLLVPLALHQDIGHVPVLIRRPPQIVALTVNGEEDFVQQPRVARSRMPASQLTGRGRPESPAPRPHRLIRQADVTLGHELSDIPIAGAEAEVEPHTVADDAGWEPMPPIEVDYR
jgi:hypothetical protein